MANIRLLFPNSEKFPHPDEIESKGYLNAVIEIDQKHYYEVVFWTFDYIDYVKKSGGYRFAEAGMIIITELKKELMLKAIQELYEKSIFYYGLKEYPKSKFKDYKEADF